MSDEQTRDSDPEGEAAASPSGVPDDKTAPKPRKRAPNGTAGAKKPPAADSPPRSGTDAVIGNVSGPGVGTLLALWVNSIPPGHPLDAYRSYLFAAVPWVTVATAVVVRYAMAAARVLIESVRQWAAFEAMRWTICRALKNPHTSDDHKKTLRTDYEELERVQIDWHKDTVRSTTSKK